MYLGYRFVFSLLFNYERIHAKKRDIYHQELSGTTLIKIEKKKLENNFVWENLHACKTGNKYHSLSLDLNIQKQQQQQRLKGKNNCHLCKLAKLTRHD